MPVVKLTDRFCDRTTPSAARVDFFDSVTPGLCLRVAPSGVRTFSVFYGPAGARVRLTLGRYPTVGLAQARTLAREAMTRVKAGEDPRAFDTGTMTIRKLVEAYLTESIRPRLKSAKAIERRLNKNVVATIGNVALNELHKRDAKRVVSAVQARGSKVEAARVFEDLRALIRWGTSEGYLDANPLAGMKKPAGRKPRTRVLTDDELATLWNGLDKALPRSRTVADIIRLCLLVGVRSAEAAQIEPCEIDAVARVWTVPGARTKNGEDHAVPLTEAAFEIANRLAAGPKLSSHAVSTCIRRAQDRFGIDQWTLHDTRRTLATNLAKMGTPPIVIAAVLNHISVTKAGVTLGVYQQYDYAREKREALTMWDERLAAIACGKVSAQITPIRA
jgi:integrase